MFKEKSEYRPPYIEFDVAPDDSILPEVLGSFENAEQAQKFMGGNLSAINQSITVKRHMDSVEKREIREQYHDLLENTLPKLEQEHAIMTQELNEAKKAEKQAADMENAAITEAKLLAKEVKRGTKEMRLDDVYTYRVPYKGRYHFYTYMDGVIKLCAIKDIPEHDKSEIWNAMAENDKFIEDNWGDGCITDVDFEENEQVTTQEGPQEQLFEQPQQSPSQEIEGEGSGQGSV